MKRIFTLLLAASALTAAVSCQKEISAPETEAPVYETMTITASTAAETKTSLGENGYSSFWSAGDQISVFDSNKGANNRCFTIVEENVEFPAQTATFSYTGEFVMPQNEQPNPTVVALYPYQENAYCDFFYYDHADITGINLPAEQTAVANGFDSDATFALALGTMATKEDLAFNNLYSLLRFTVSTPNVKKVTVTIEGEDAFIAGEAKIDLTINLANVQEGKPAFESPVLTASGSKTVTLTCEEGFATDATYYIAVAPVTYTSLAVALDEVEVKKSTTAKTLEANTVYGLGELAFNKLYLVPSSNTTGTNSESWAKGDERYAAYFYGDGDGWVDMSDTDGNGLYECVIPTDKDYTHVIFCRMNGSNKENCWDAKWAQTVDLSINPNHCYTVTTKKEDKYEGTWSEYTKSQTVYLKPSTKWKEANARFAVYFFNESGKNSWVDMINTGEGIYECITPKGYLKMIYVRMDPSKPANNWDNDWAQTSNLNVPTDGMVTFDMSANGEWETTGVWK